MKLTVNEPPEKKNLETPGGVAHLAQFGGRDGGLPFFAVVDPEERLIVNSMRPRKDLPISENIGYPTSPDEIAWFLAMIKKAAPAVSSEELSRLETLLVQQTK